MPRPRPPEKSTGKRCAVYTRKSSEDGLDQDFNSLDAQREACEAFIRSQRSEGWICLPQMYDDGGVSGGTLERPALKRLLDEVETGRIDAIIVYKVDRLTRSLHDFARLVEVFDRQGVSFVSVTQQFNTTTSMGRLTLNMLLTFAQFEREVTAERIRDKIAASKRKGMWMGGLPPLGYDVRERKLVINDGEAATVRHIFRRYAALGSVRALKDDLDRDGIVAKQRTDRFGRHSGGTPLPRATLYRMLQNRLYRGEVVHREARYPGEHEAIIDEALWANVQRTLDDNRVEHALATGAAEPSLLAGLLYDDAGAPMTPSHASKGGRRYRYYVSRPLITAGRSAAPQARRAPAGDLEAAVAERVQAFLADQAAVLDALEGLVADASTRVRIAADAAALATEWRDRAPAEQRRLLRALITRIDLGRSALAIHLRPAQLPVLSGEAPITPEAPALVLDVACALKRVGIEMRLLIDGAASRRAPDRSLKRLLGQAHRFQAMVLRGDGAGITQLAAAAGVSKSYFTRVLRLSFLAPDIIDAVLHDRHPITLSAQRLTKLSDLPIAWNEQRQRLGLR
jgi:DNA invertase Pin-like site-specific DNA recombinase